MARWTIDRLATSRKHYNKQILLARMRYRLLPILCTTQLSQNVLCWNLLFELEQ